MTAMARWFAVTVSLGRSVFAWDLILLPLLCVEVLGLFVGNRRRVVVRLCKDVGGRGVVGLSSALIRRGISADENN